LKARSLLDVNVLVALFDPDHAYHEAAHQWFARHRAQGWATCPLTENGLVRVMSHPAYAAGAGWAAVVVGHLNRTAATAACDFSQNGQWLRAEV
jgi:uncharacterized protein